MKNERMYRSHGLTFMVILTIQRSAAAFKAIKITRSECINDLHRKRIIIHFSSLSGSGGNMTSGDVENRLFGRFKVSSNQIFYESVNSFAMVNLRPLVPGHVLVVSNRITPMLSDLDADEYDDLWKTVRKVQNGLKNLYKCDAFNVAVQDGAGAGQSVPHVHVHILPRFCGDLERNDDIYDQLESWAPRDELSCNKPKLQVPGEMERCDRTIEEMANEASVYRNSLLDLK